MPKQQSQKQKQSVSQKVVIQLADIKKAKKRRKPRKKVAKSDGVASEYLQGRNPPIVAYQYTTVGPSAPSATPVRQSMPYLEDVGSIGQAEILSAPTKKEQLEELITPIPKAFEEPFKPQPLTKKLGAEPKAFPEGKLASSTELFGMGPDDFQISNPMLNQYLGLASRNPRGDEDAMSNLSTTINLQTGRRQPRKNSKADLARRYQAMTDDPVPTKMKAADFKKLVEKMESV